MLVGVPAHGVGADVEDLVDLGEGRVQHLDVAELGRVDQPGGPDVGVVKVLVGERLGGACADASAGEPAYLEIEDVGFIIKR